MNKEIILSELQFKAVRSSGAGGQNVNKVSSKVIVTFDLQNSNGLNEEEKTWLQEKLKTKLTQELVLQLSCDEDRSQKRNKDLVTNRLFELLEQQLQKPKPRKATKIPKEINEKRLQEKKKSAEIKESRKKPDF
ncbi:alternative ribosome rescue aminoacyl-tRNA hydrolase ArfB [Flavobacterium sp.]|uniref:alternative ribosome rescue aminoacyl-tRNA hydrolase ArfB n=1 Tax=Flavobacterium sp. TaxID=239 RepID=UPI0035293A82